MTIRLLMGALLLLCLCLAELGSRRRLRRLQQPVGSRWRLVADGAALLALVALASASQPAPTTSATQRTIALVVDVSTSMAVADGAPDRIGQARRELLTLIELAPEARFALIPFAGEPVLQVAATADRAALRFFINTLEPGVITAPGSAPEEAALMAQRLLGGEPGERRVLLLSDGERTLLAPPPGLRNDIPVDTLALGSDAGGEVPGAQGALARPDRQRLARLAAQTGGQLLSAAPGEIAVLRLLAAATTPHRPHAPASAPLAALCLLLVRLFLPPTRHRWRRRLAGAGLLAALLIPGCQAPDSERPALAQPHFARGLAAAAAGDLQTAQAAFADAGAMLDGAARSAALYNRGTVLLQSGQPRQALPLFEAALLLTPGDFALRSNLLLALQESESAPTGDDSKNRDASAGGDTLSPEQARTLLHSIEPDPAALPATDWVAPRPVREVW